MDVLKCKLPSCEILKFIDNEHTASGERLLAIAIYERAEMKTVALAKEGTKPNQNFGVGKMGFDKNTEGGLGDYFIKYLEFLIPYYSVIVMQCSRIP